MKQTPLRRRVPISKKGRKTKGQIGENEVKAILIAHGFPLCRRNFASGAAGGNDLIGVPGYGIEVKRQENTKPWEWYEQCKEAASPTETPVVVFRRSRSDWMALLSFEDLLGVIRESQL